MFSETVKGRGNGPESGRFLSRVETVLKVFQITERPDGPALLLKRRRHVDVRRLRLRAAHQARTVEASVKFLGRLAKVWRRA